MKRSMGLIMISLLLLLFSNSTSHAITIGFDPVTQDVSLGSPAVVDLFISGLGDGTAPSLGTFDLDVTFDSSILSFSSAAYGDPVLGDQLDLFGFGSIITTTPGAGYVNLFELSLDSALDLVDFQAGSFILATLTFDTLAPGTSPLDIHDNYALGDAWGDPLIASTEGGNIHVASVPEPSTILLLSSGLLGIGYFGRRKLFQ
jgi:hypothetical protein